LESRIDRAYRLAISDPRAFRAYVRYLNADELELLYRRLSNSFDHFGDMFDAADAKAKLILFSARHDTAPILRQRAEQEAMRSERWNTIIRWATLLGALATIASLALILGGEG
jgi:hypothetical protein